jgi:hypothetical protein
MMNREPINAKIALLEDFRRQLLEKSKTPSGAQSHSVAAQKRLARAEEVAEQIKGLTIRDDAGAACAYDVPATALNGVWRSAAFPSLPALGTPVLVKINNIGPGTVAGYFFEHGYVGVIVQLENAPAWHQKQNEGKWHSGYALVFGSEINGV